MSILFRLAVVICGINALGAALALRWQEAFLFTLGTAAALWFVKWSENNL